MAVNYKKIGFKCIANKVHQFYELAKFLHDNPELAYKEYKGHDYLTKFLQDHDFLVERRFIHETGFRATFKTADGPHVAILVEYDALPELGQACGHNIIAQSSIAAAIGLRAILAETRIPCKISVLGTPAEEGGGGKLKFIESGVFKDVDIAIMSHPFKYDMVNLPHLALIGNNLIDATSLKLTVQFTGKESHASLAPWMGHNALDAAVLAYQSISCLRQQVHPDCRIHGIISKGGDAPNIIPNFTEMKYFIRAPTSDILKELVPRITACFSSAAIATGCEQSLVESCPMYTDIKYNQRLGEVYRHNALQLGVEFVCDSQGLTGSSDVGNVSYACPTIQPMFHIGTLAENHTIQFAQCAGTKEASAYGIRQAKIMLGTLVDVILDDKLLFSIKEEFST